MTAGSIDELSSEFSKKFDPALLEKWYDKWYEWGIPEFDASSSKPSFIIDTPPPFTSGIPHMGHSLWWSWNDLISRYKRMRGFNCFLAQGWDCQGLPTETKIDKKGIDKRDTKKFLSECQNFTEFCIDTTKAFMRGLGYAPDWSREYKTMDPEYHKFIQESLISFFEKGLLYREKHPTFWCPICETAIAKTDTERKSKNGKLYYLKFDLAGGGAITIATTRPELLGACLGIFYNPKDSRYSRLKGKKAICDLSRKK